MYARLAAKPAPFDDMQLIIVCRLAGLALAGVLIGMILAKRIIESSIVLTRQVCLSRTGTLS